MQLPYSNGMVFYTLNSSSESKPKLHQLQSLCVGERRLRIIDSVAADWEGIAIALQFEASEIETVRSDCHFQSKPACRNIFGKWLDGQGCQPVTWQRLGEALADVGFSTLARDLQEVLGN